MGEKRCKLLLVHCASVALLAGLRNSLFFNRLKQAGVAQLVEHDVANVVVVGSNPITRS